MAFLNHVFLVSILKLIKISMLELHQSALLPND
jgi:hypothetical protein